MCKMCNGLYQEVKCVCIDAIYLIWIDKSLEFTNTQ